MLYIILGNFITALGVQCFLIQSNLIAAGVTGFGLILNNFFKIDISLAVLFINVVTFLLGYYYLKKEFALKVLVSTFAYPLSLKIITLLSIPPLMDDPLINCLIGGFMIALGASFIIKNGGSSGGFEIICIILERYKNIPIAKTLRIFDLSIMALQIAGHSPSQIIYSIISVLTISYSLNYLLAKGTTYAQVLIISSYYKELQSLLHNELNVGITLLNGQKSYSEEPTQVLLSVMNYNKLPKLKQLIQSIDSKAFIIVSHIDEINGYMKESSN